MVALFGFNTLLFLARWVFIGLIYLALFVVIFAVRRELSMQVRGGRAAPRPAPGLAPGRLRVLSGGSDRAIKPGQVIPLGLETHLGAAADNDVVLRDQFMSGHHAILRWDGAGWWLEDLGSKNGSRVNQTPVYPHRPVRAQSGARLGLGDVQLELLED
jgi:hypothetical protein